MIIPETVPDIQDNKASSTTPISLSPDQVKDVTIMLQPAEISTKCYGPASGKLHSASFSAFSDDALTPPDSIAKNATILPTSSAIKTKIFDTTTISLATILKNSASVFGYFISNVYALGKIPAEKTENGFLVQIPNFQGTMKLKSCEVVEKYLNHYIQSNLDKSAYLENNIKWRFVPCGGEERFYKIHNKKDFAQCPAAQILQNAKEVLSATTQQTTSSTNNLPNNTFMYKLNKLGAKIRNIRPNSNQQSLLKTRNRNSIGKTTATVTSTVTSSLPPQSSSSLVKNPETLHEVILIDDDDD